MKEAFNLHLEEIANVIAKSFIPALARIMNIELKKSITGDDTTVIKVDGGEASDFLFDLPANKVSKAKKRAKEDDEYEDEKAGDEDGVSARFGHKKEMASYGDMDDEEKAIAKKSNKDENMNLFDNESDDEEGEDNVATITDDEEEEDEDEDGNFGSNSVKIDKRKNMIHLRPLTVDPAARPLLMVGLVERAASSTIVRCLKKIDEAFVNEEDGRGRCLQTAGCSFEQIWKLSTSLVDHDRLASNDIWAIRLAYGVEAARMNIVAQIRGVFAVYGISVDPRHLSLIADHMTFGGEFKAMNRIGMADVGSAFLQMSFETTANFMVEAALNNRVEPMMSPSANIVLGRPVKHGTGAFECFASA